MRISVTVFVILISTYIVNASVLDPVIENVVHLKANKPPPAVSGIWKKKTIWKPRWVKDWKSAKVVKPVWRKVWSPVQIREWVPIPKPPPGWDSMSTQLVPVIPKPQKSPVKDSLGHDSFPVHTSTKLPLWDPVPYPESQQPPPPPPFPQPLHNTGTPCGKGGCDSSPSQTFNHQQISEILGPRYHTPEYPPNPEYSETVNHLTRLPPEGSNWRPPPPPPPSPNIHLNSFPGLPEFLIPPKSPPVNNFRPQPPINNPPVHHPPPFEPQNNIRWTPLPPDNKPKGHFITKAPDHPYKFQLPEVLTNNTTNPAQRGVVKTPENEKQTLENLKNGLGPHADGDFIQEAQLVGEYHYSEFDLQNVKSEQNKAQPQKVELQLQPQKVEPQLQQQKIALQPQQQKIAVQPQQQKIAPQTQKLKQETARPTTKQFPVRNDQIQKEIKPETENRQGAHIQKKHISSQPNLHFQQQEAQIKEIFPIFKPLPTGNHTLHRFEFPPTNQHKPPTANPSSTKLLPISQSNSTNPVSNSQQEIKIYPVYENPESIPTNLFPPNHRFSLHSAIQPETNETATKVPSNHKPEPRAPQNPTLNKSNSIQLVFATTPLDYESSKEDYQKTTTTEPYEVVFSSSLLSTTEAVTKSPVVIVTPVSPKL